MIVGLLRLIGIERAQEERSEPQRKPMTAEELKRRQGAVEIVCGDGCSGYYVAMQLCGKTVICAGKSIYQADWDRYGHTWIAYPIEEGNA